MLVAFVESIRYVGHLLPIAFLRVFLGYYYFNQAVLQLHSDFLTRAYLAEDIRAYLPQSTAPDWYKSYLETIVIPNWQIFAWVLVVAYLLIGLSYILGYLVRPMSLIAIVIGIMLMTALGPDHQILQLQSTFVLVVHFTLLWLGAGRCLGFDYYFYKRRRGIWW